MSIQKKYSREEISKILKIAADLDKASINKEDGLTEEELKKVAEETGLHPSLITKAIFQMEQNDSKIEESEYFQEDHKFKSSFLADGVIDDVVWEEIVGEIRSTHGGIGKVSMLGTTYEWEQRKRNVGYLQVTATPKKGHTKVSINSNYTYYSRTLGFFMGLGGFMLGVILAEAFGVYDDTSILFALLGGFAGFTSSRFFFNRWMKKKTAILKHMVKRVSKVIQESNMIKSNVPVSEIEIPGDEYSPAQSTSSSDSVRKAKNA